MSTILFSGLYGRSPGQQPRRPDTVDANSAGDEDLGHEYLRFSDGGSSADILESYDPGQKQAMRVRDPRWWQRWSDGPHIERVVIRWISKATRRHEGHAA